MAEFNPDELICPGMGTIQFSATSGGAAEVLASRQLVDAVRGVAGRTDGDAGVWTGSLCLEYPDRSFTDGLCRVLGAADALR